MQVLLGGGAVGKRTGALKDQINVECAPGKYRHLRHMAQVDQRLINRQKLPGAGDASRIAAIVGIVARKVNHSIRIGDLVDSRQFQTCARIVSGMVDPKERSPDPPKAIATTLSAVMPKC